MSGERTDNMETNQRNLKTLYRLFLIFFKAGTFTFAGGLAMLPVIQRDVVEKYGMMSGKDFLEYATLSQTLPGVIALNCAVFVGRRAAGTLGMLVAGFGAVFSAFVLMIGATILLRFIPQHGPFVGAMQGIRAAAAALVLSAAFAIGKHNLKTAFAIMVMLLSFGLVVFLGISAVYIILGAGLAGYVFHKISEKRKAGAAKEGEK